MNEAVNQPDETASTPTDAHENATRIVPMQRDHLGRPFWESYLTPQGYQVAAPAGRNHFCTWREL